MTPEVLGPRLRAQVDIEKAVRDAVIEHDLAFTELVAIIAGVLAHWSARRVNG